MKNIRLSLILALTIIMGFSSLVHGEDIPLSAKSAILIDCNTGRVLYEKNPHIPMSMASTTKIMTALIAIERGNLDDIVEITKESVGIEGSSLYLREGEKISLRDLLYGLMLRSGNDSAVAIAKYIGGNEESFVRYMNEKAKEIGAMNTSFSNPHGLEGENHYSTAYDLGLITKEAFKKVEFKEIVGSKSYNSNRVENNYFYNKNKTLWEYEGGDGVKTGYTMKSGRCLVSSASKNNMRLIAVVLNAGDWFNDNYRLLNYGFDNFKPYLIYDKGQYINKAMVKDGMKEYVDLVSEKELIYPLRPEERKKIKLNIKPVKKINAPIEKGDIMGIMETYLNGVLIKRDNIIAKNTIDRTGLINRIFNRLKINNS